MIDLERWVLVTLLFQFEEALCGLRWFGVESIKIKGGRI